MARNFEKDDEKEEKVSDDDDAEARMCLSNKMTGSYSFERTLELNLIDFDSDCGVRYLPNKMENTSRHCTK